MPVNIQDDEILVRQAKAKDVEAFEMIYNKYRDSLYGTAFRLTSSKQQTEDCVQITFIKLYNKIDKIQRPEMLKSYMFKILINTINDFRVKSRYVEDLDKHNDALFYKPKFDLQIQLEEAIATLPEKMKECFILFAIEGFRQEEIAETLDISVGTVKAHIFQAKQKLKLILQ